MIKMCKLSNIVVLCMKEVFDSFPLVKRMRAMIVYSSKELNIVDFCRDMTILA